MKKGSYFINFALILISFLVSFLVAEIVLRIILFSNIPLFDKLRNPSHYADYFSEDDYWKLQYLFGGEFSPPESPHPVLGWVGSFSRDNFIHNKARGIGNRRPVLLYGDSFAACVVPGACFQDILNYDGTFSEDNYLLNYGVGGYGVDQIFLLFKNSVNKYNNPFVIISLMTHDLDRSILSVRVGQKPYFRVEDGVLRLDEKPIDPDPDAFFSNNPPRIISYLYRKVLYGKYLPEKLTSFLKRENYYKRKKIQVNEKIILEILKELRAKDLDYVFLIFHPHWPGESAIDSSGWRNSFLKRLLDENNVPYIWSEKLIMYEVKANDISVDDLFFDYSTIYLYAGHPTEYLNKLIAKEIKRYVIETEWRNGNYNGETANCTTSYKDSLAHIIPIPTDKESYQYYATSSPVSCSDPSMSKPVSFGSVTSGGDLLSVKVWLNQFSGPVDIYYAFTAITDPEHINVLNQDGKTFKLFSTSKIKDSLSAGITLGIKPWKANITSPINEHLFDMLVSDIPSGRYVVYLMVTPAGSVGSYYLWKISFLIP